MPELPISIRSLREEFPHVPFKVLDAVFKTAIPLYSNDDLFALWDILEEEQKKALEEETRGKERVERNLQEIHSSMLHEKLDIHLAGADDDHLQAIIVYAFLRPPQERTFVNGHRGLSTIEIREITGKKLESQFDKDKFQKAFSHLRKMHIVQEYPGGGFFLNLKCKMNKEFLAKIKRFLHET